MFSKFCFIFSAKKLQKQSKIKLLIVGNHKINVTFLNWLTMQSRIVYNCKEQYGLDSEAIYAKIMQISYIAYVRYAFLKKEYK